MLQERRKNETRNHLSSNSFFSTCTCGLVPTCSSSRPEPRFSTSISRQRDRKDLKTGESFSGLCSSGVPLVAIKYKACGRQEKKQKHIKSSALSGWKPQCICNITFATLEGALDYKAHCRSLRERLTAVACPRTGFAREKTQFEGLNTLRTSISTMKET